jgi:hypothetical protein
MSLPRLPWQRSDSLGEYLYNPRTDEIIFRNGTRYARPPHVPRNSLLRAAYDGPLPVFQPQYLPQTQGYQIQQGPGPSQPPLSQPQRVGAPRGGHLQAAGRGRGQLQGPDQIQPRTQPQGMGQLTQAMASTSLTPSVPNPATNQVRTRTIQRNGAQLVQSVDTRTGVQTIVQNAPPTPGNLQAEGITVQRELFGTGGNTEALFPEYILRPAKFFCLGRVFLVLWSQPAGGNGSNAGTVVTMQERGTVRNHLGELVFSKVRRFVVIRESGQYCSALPITTYSGQGVAKHRVVKSEHAIIYTGRAPPEPRVDERPSRGETGMRPQPIRVDPDNQTDRLDPMSRIHFGGVHQVHHNVKTKSLGIVNIRSINALQSQFLNVWQDQFPSGRRQAQGAQRTTTVAGAVGAGAVASTTAHAPANDSDDNDDDEENVEEEEEEASGEENASDRE